MQRKAQQEIDEHIGQQRLPDILDRENLPYVNAIVKEVLRIYPSLPLGVPHVTTVEDEYKGMRIPKGSVVIPNVWYVLVPRSRLWLDFSNCWMHDRGMARDKDVYGSDTDVFRPERFIEGELRDSDGIVFGFGRRYVAFYPPRKDYRYLRYRICPGKYMAQNSLFIAIASILHAFEIDRAVDHTGAEIPIEARWVSGLTV